MNRLLRALDDHWFAPAPLRDLAIARIVIVGAQLLFFYPHLGDQLRLAAAPASTFLSIPALKVLLLPVGGWGVRPDPTLLQAVWVLGVIVGVAAVVGVYTRLSMFVFAATNTLLVAHGYSYNDFHHPQAPLIIALWVLALAPSGAALSLDRLRDRIRVSTYARQFRPQDPEEERSPYARWPLRLIQWTLVLVYFSAGLSKMFDGGFAWFNGYTMSYFLIQDGIRNDIPLALSMSEHLTLLSLLAVGTVLFELSFALAVLVPSVTLLYLLAGAGIHTGIYALMRAPFFQYIALYVVFLENVRRSLPKRSISNGREWTIFYDGLCPLCIRTATTLDALDLGNRLRFVDLESAPETELPEGLARDDLREAMHVAGPEGQVRRGFEALRALGRALPLLWPMLPLLYAPGADRFGPGWYDRVAHQRGRNVCSTGSCAAEALPVSR